MKSGFQDEGSAAKCTMAGSGQLRELLLSQVDLPEAAAIKKQD
jgi:hypothetical protein